MLNSLLQQFSKILKKSSKIYGDSNKLQCDTISKLFTTQSQDIAILGRDQMTVIELTICFEDKTIRMPEVAAYNPFAKYLKSVGVNSDHAIFKCIQTSIRASYFIFCRRINLGPIQNY